MLDKNFKCPKHLKMILADFELDHPTKRLLLETHALYLKHQRDGLKKRVTTESAADPA